MTGNLTCEPRAVPGLRLIGLWWLGVGGILFKGVYLLIILATLVRWPVMDVEKFYDVNARWPRSGEPVFASHWATWDAAHYLYLSEVGYHRHVWSCAFYPLWPLLVRWSAPVFGGSHVVAGMVLSNVFSLLAWLVFYHIVQARWGPKAAGWALVFLVSFPWFAILPVQLHGESVFAAGTGLVVELG